MMALRTFKYISVRLSSILLALCLSLSSHTVSAQEIQFGEKEQKSVHLIDGIAVGADILGFGLKAMGSDWSQMEVMARINMLDKYFPIFEMGIGEADHEGVDLDNHFTVRAPYFRIGADYNFTKKHNGNRLFLGLRYGFSFFNYNIDSPTPLEDPIWGAKQEVNFSDLSGNSHWAELVFGLETRLWSIVHLGWDVRMKLRIVENPHSIGSPWYVPGFGLNDTTSWGGSFKVLFDI